MVVQYNFCAIHITLLSFILLIMSLLRCCYYLDASQGFLEDSVLKGEEDVVIRSANAVHPREIGGSLRLTVLHHMTSTVWYKSLSNAITVHKLVVMDGAMGIFRAQLNTSYSGMESCSFEAGGTITVGSWDWIWCDNSDKLDCKALIRAILLINYFNWKAPPKPEDCSIGKNAVGIYVSWDAIDYIQEHSYVGWMACFNRDLVPRPFYKLYTKQQLREGCFIKHVKARSLFLSKTTSEDECEYDEEDDECLYPPTVCQCKQMCGIAVCICVQFPISTIHYSREIIFDEASERLYDGDSVAYSFNDLTPSKKRWCMFWWYSVNIFQVLGYLDRKRLPGCVVDMVRRKYPNKKRDFFTGYKRAEEEHVRATKSRLEHLEELTDQL